MAAQICSQCGYEGRGKAASGQGGGGAFRVLGILTMLPFHSLWRLFGGGGGKHCLHCQTPTMVKLNSEAGRLVRRRLDIELGLVQVSKPEAPTKAEIESAEVFGNERSAERVVTKKPVDPEEW